MSLNRVACPSCKAGLKSAAGFKVGQKLRCPKCQNVFAVPEPELEVLDDEEPIPAKAVPKKPAAKKPVVAIIEDDDEEDEAERPRKKKKKKGYKNSPLRFAILGVLLIVLGVMAYLLYEKNQNANKPAPATESNDNDEDEDAPVLPPPRAKGTQPPATKGSQPPAFKMPKFGGGSSTPTESQDRLKRIAMAMHNFSKNTDDASSFPAQSFPPGKPGLSWRVAILPYLGEEKLYSQFKLDEPWDSENNKALLVQMPSVYASPGGIPGQTYCKVFNGGGAWFDRQARPKMFIPDGSSLTILMAEGGTPVLWTKPEDFPYDPAKPLPELTPPDGSENLTAVMGDGSTRVFDLSKIKADENGFRLLITIADTMPADLDKFAR